MKYIPGLRNEYVKGVKNEPLHVLANFWTLKIYGASKTGYKLKDAEKTGYVTGRVYAEACVKAGWIVNNYGIPQGLLKAVIDAAKAVAIGNESEYKYCVFQRTDPKDQNKGLSKNGKRMELCESG